MKHTREKITIHTFVFTDEECRDLIYSLGTILPINPSPTADFYNALSSRNN